MNFSITEIIVAIAIIWIGIALGFPLGRWSVPSNEEMTAREAAAFARENNAKELLAHVEEIKKATEEARDDANRRIAKAWCREHGIKDKSTEDTSLETCISTKLQTEQDVLNGTSDISDDVSPIPPTPDE
jgi:hypothetical protein